MPTDNVRQQLIIGCRRFLKEAVDTSARYFGSSEPPRRTITSQVLEPSGSGNYTGKHVSGIELDRTALWNQISGDMKGTSSWEQARKSVQEYIDVHRIKPTGFWLHSVDTHFLLPVVERYVVETDSLSYRRVPGDKAIRALLRHLDSEDVEVTGLIVLRGFSAECPFRIERNIDIHPIHEAELLALGRNDAPWNIPLALRPPLRTPATDWWICEVKLPNRRGTADGWNGINDVRDSLALALRAFKSGGVSLGLATKQLSDAFGRTGQVYGGRFETIARGQPSYELSETDIPTFVRFWRRMSAFIGERKHYLQVPIRRLRAAGTRSEMEDALVDYVVGLEALLGKADERTELGYRFRVRGSVLLAKRRSDRKKRLPELRELYDLRSKIVHGQNVSTAKLEQALPVAESSLRRIWNWYFANWYSDTNNGAAIDRIDDLLLG